MEDNEAALIEEVAKMRGNGYAESKRDTLPLVYFKVWKHNLNMSCDACIQKGWDDVMSWYKRKTKIKIMGQFKFKGQYAKKELVINVGGVGKVVITNDNLTDERAQMLLDSKYAHVLEYSDGTAIDSKAPAPVKLVEVASDEAPIVAPELTEVTPEANLLPTEETEAAPESDPKLDATVSTLPEAPAEDSQSKKKGGKGK